jgi:hypothetical protein
MTSGKEVITIDQVTPELAAQIVKHFIIPMFDSDVKKGLRKKYGAMMSTQQPANKKAGGPSEFEPTILGDLKLTDNLSTQLSKVRNEVDDITERCEATQYERDQLKKQLNKLKQKHLQ